jgi:uncharacterized damage-inducible protein DinB
MLSFSKAILVVTAASLLSCAPSSTPPPPGDALVTSSHELFTHISGLIMRSADKIPDDLWSYQPTPEVRTVGQLFAHIADGSNHICALAVGGEPAPGSVEKSATTKADIVAALKREFAGCEADYATMSPETAVQTIDVGGGQKRTRIAEMDYEVAHTWEHYGNLVTYMRLKGIVPPSSEPAAK